MLIRLRRKKRKQLKQYTDLVVNACLRKYRGAKQEEGRGKMKAGKYAMYAAKGQRC